MENNLKKQPPPPILPPTKTSNHKSSGKWGAGGVFYLSTLRDGVSRKYASDQLILASPNVKTKRIPALCEKCAS